MLFDSSIRKELARSFGATVVVLVTVVMTMMLIRTLGQAYKGSVSPSDVLLVMGLTVLGQLPMILGLGLFVAVVGTLSRMYRDSEMVIWFAAGQGMASLLRPLLRFAWPVIAVTAALGLLILPWSNQQIEQIKSEFEQRSDIDRIAPGEFQESAGGTRVFFIDKDTPSDMAASNVFIVTNERGRESVTSARGARLEIIKGERVAVLSDGQRMETQASDGGVKISEFKEYGTQMGGSGSRAAAEELAARSTPTHLLVQRTEPIFRAELGWRLGLPLAALNFVILGLAVASVNPRAGGSSSLMIALFAFIVYYNLMTLAESWVAASKLSMPTMAGLLHGGTLVIGLLVLAARHNRWSLRDLWRKRNRSPELPA
ncbi:LPS export ABC transporter permease LptF [Comamonas composti]|uniref:LPS export ABC transporter permease LptF n=1 Tax=Comamonas composti TaxID=408558 RepID=UPI00047ACB80|nr:LPS export ABC transporter permease LptF [Comamonas composti]